MQLQGKIMKKSTPTFEEFLKYFEDDAEDDPKATFRRLANKQKDLDITAMEKRIEDDLIKLYEQCYTDNTLTNIKLGYQMLQPIEATYFDYVNSIYENGHGHKKKRNISKDIQIGIINNVAEYNQLQHLKRMIGMMSEDFEYTDIQITLINRD